MMYKIEWQNFDDREKAEVFSCGIVRSGRYAEGVHLSYPAKQCKGLGGIPDIHFEASFLTLAFSFDYDYVCFV